MSHSSLFAAYSFSNNCREAMRAILDLKFEDARLLIAEEKEANPKNGYIIYLEHYSEAIELILTEEPGLYQHLIDNLDRRLEEMEDLDDGSPDFEWLKAEMLFHAGLAQVKFGTRVSGAAKIFSSYRRIRDHWQEYPEFWQNRKLVGVYNVMFDFIPPFMRWAADMFGLSGNAELGMYQLERYCETAAGTMGLAEESVLVISLAYKMIGEDEKGLEFLAHQKEEALDNTLVKYLYAVTASYTYHNDLALRLLGEIRPEGLQVRFFSLDYLTGRCKLNHLEQDASFYLERYLEDYPGNDYKKDVSNRLAYYYLLQGNREEYANYRDRILLVGSELRDRDQEALIEYRSGITPHPGLLRSRLLCDGGYFDEALAELQGIDTTGFGHPSYRLEYHYRLGRILQLTGKAAPAITSLSICYNAGVHLPYTFATRAALNLGKLFEESGDAEKAAAWYEKCIQAYSSGHTTEGVKADAERGIKRARAKF